MNPVRASTSKSCAAKVVVSTTPVGGPTAASGRGWERKWVDGRLLLGSATLVVVVANSVSGRVLELAENGSDMLDMAAEEVVEDEDER